MYLLVKMPVSHGWVAELEREFAEIDRYFTHETIVDYPELGLYRLRPH